MATPTPSPSAAQRALTASSVQVLASLIKASDGKGKGLFLSPVSIAYALALTYNGAGGLPEMQDWMVGGGGARGRGCARRLGLPGAFDWCSIVGIGWLQGEGGFGEENASDDECQR